MKKIISLILIGLLLFSLCACGEKETALSDITEDSKDFTGKSTEKQVGADDIKTALIKQYSTHPIIELKKVFDVEQAKGEAPQTMNVICTAEVGSEFGSKITKWSLVYDRLGDAWVCSSAEEGVSSFEINYDYIDNEYYDGYKAFLLSKNDEQNDVYEKVGTFERDELFFEDDWIHLDKGTGHFYCDYLEYHITNHEIVKNPIHGEFTFDPEELNWDVKTTSPLYTDCEKYSVYSDPSILEEGSILPQPILEVVREFYGFSSAGTDFAINGASDEENSTETITEGTIIDNQTIESEKSNLGSIGVFYATDNINVRSGAGKNYEKVNKVYAGDIIQVFNKVENVDGYTWFEIKYENSGEWIAFDSSWLTTINDEQKAVVDKYSGYDGFHFICKCATDDKHNYWVIRLVGGGDVYALQDKQNIQNVTEYDWSIQDLDIGLLDALYQVNDFNLITFKSMKSNGTFTTDYKGIKDCNVESWTVTDSKGSSEYWYIYPYEMGYDICRATKDSSGTYNLEFLISGE